MTDVAHWPRVPIADVTERPKRVDWSRWPDATFRYIDVGSIDNARFEIREARTIPVTDAPSRAQQLVQPEDVLFATVRTYLRNIALVPVQLNGHVASTAFSVLRAKPRVLPKYLYYYVQSADFIRETSAQQRGVSYPAVTDKQVRAMQVPLPSIAQQERIVAAIEEEFSHLGAATESIRSVNAKLTAMRSSVLGAVSDGEGEWTVLGDVAEIVGGVTKDTKGQGGLGLVEVPYLRVANVQRGYLDLAEVARIRVPPAKAAALRLETGDVLFNEGGDRDKLGRGWVWEGQIDGCIHQNHVFRARLKNGEFDPKFVSMHGNTFGQAWFKQNGKQTTNLASINFRTLKSFPLPRIPLREQRNRVSQALRQLDAADSLDRALREAGRRKESLRAAVLAAAFSGNLVV
jgi:type I restriction enzyme S subunit